MSITRINEFQAQEGRGADLRDLIGSFLPMIESAAGCVSCRLLTSRSDPARIVVIEVWESVEAHQAAVTDIPPEVMQQAMALLAGAPKGDYFD